VSVGKLRECSYSAPRTLTQLFSYMAHASREASLLRQLRSTRRYPRPPKADPRHPSKRPPRDCFGSFAMRLSSTPPVAMSRMKLASWLVSQGAWEACSFYFDAAFNACERSLAPAVAVLAVGEARRAFIDPEAGAFHIRVIILRNLCGSRCSALRAFQIDGVTVSRCHALNMARLTGRCHTRQPRRTSN